MQVLHRESSKVCCDIQVAIRDGSDLVVAAQGAADGDGEVLFVDPVDLVVLERDVQPSPHGTIISFDAKYLYVTNIAEGGANAVMTYDMTTRAKVPGCEAVTTTQPTPHNPAVTLDGGRLFITHSGAEANVTSVFDVDEAGCVVPGTEQLVTTGLNPFGITVITNAADTGRSKGALGV